MTCVIGMIKDDKVYIGADNVGSNLSIKISRNDNKVFKKDEMIIGCTTSFRMINILQYQLQLPLHDPKISTDEYMYTSFIEEVRYLFREKGFSKIDSNVEIGGDFIVGYKGNLYNICEDFQIEKPADNFACVGSGMPYAYGAMKILIENKLLSAEEIITKALEVAEYYNPFVRKPFNIMSL